MDSTPKEQTMARSVSGKHVAILATHGFEESELSEPRRALQEQGAEVDIVAPGGGSIRAWSGKDWGGDYQADKALADASEADYDALVLPGGLFNPDTLRQNQEAVTFVRKFFESHKPVAAICHGPWLLVNAGVLQGRRVTSFPSLARDLENAGATWSDEEVVVDSGLVTSRKPDDLPAFNAKLLEELAEGKHQRQTA